MKNETLFCAACEIVCSDHADFVDVAGTILYYVLGVDNAYACQRKLKKHLEKSEAEYSAQKFRLALTDMSYLHVNLKFFALNLLKHGTSTKNLNFYAESFSIHRNDAVLLKKILRSRHTRQELTNSKRVRDIRNDQITLDAFHSIFQVFDEIYPELQKHIKSKTYKKLRFISTSSNTEFYDLHMELVCKALQTYIKMVPTDKTKLHIANYLRGTINNHTINMIKSFTAKKRQRIKQAGADGFGGFKYEISVLSENQMQSNVEGSFSYDEIQSVPSQQDCIEKYESKLSYSMLLRKYGTTLKKRAFIRLMSCTESQKFTMYLLDTKKIAEGQDNVDFYDKVGNREYFETVCVYMGVNVQRGERFLKTIAKRAYLDLYEESPNAVFRG